MEKWIIGGIIIVVIIIMGAIQLNHSLKKPAHMKDSDSKKNGTNNKA
jgi:hypothetical protein